MTKNIGFPKTLIFVNVTTSMKGNIFDNTQGIQD